MKLLVLAAEPVDAQALRDALGDDVEGAQVLVVSPALNQSRLAFWVSDSDDAIADARASGDETVSALRDEGVQATGTTGESEPLVALQDALATFPAERIAIFVRPEEEQSYREDDICDASLRRFDVPTTLHIAPAS